MSFFNKKASRITWADGRSGHEKIDPASEKARRLRASRNTSLPSVRAISPQGNVVDLPTATGRGIPNHQNTYGPAVLEDKINRGWVLYDSLPAQKREKLIRDRRETARKRSEAFQSRAQTSDAKLADAMRAITEMYAEQKAEADKAKADK